MKKIPYWLLTWLAFFCAPVFLLGVAYQVCVIWFGAGKDWVLEVDL